jgi:CheY-like chemotaxis protein
MDAPSATILIVEDNVLNLELATDLLTHEGIVMDLRLPGMDGYPQQSFPK